MSKKDYADIPQVVLPVEKSFSDIERDLQIEMEDAVVGAIDNVFLLTNLTLNLGTATVYKELKIIAKKYGILE